MNPQQPSRAVMLVGHGTRDELGTKEFFELGERLAKRCHPIPVESALLEFQQPTIPEAWQRLVDQACSHIHIAPLLLFAAGHAKSDIPEIVAECAAKTPGITFDQCRPLSRHGAIIELVVDRIRQSISSANVPPEQVAVVMVGRGSYDPCAQADMRVLSEIVRSRINVGRVDTAFYAMAEPRLPAVLNEVANQVMAKAMEPDNTGDPISTVIVHPHLLFHGRLFESISRQTLEASERFPEIQWMVSGYLGPEENVAEAIHFRVLPRENGATDVENADSLNVTAR